MSVRLARKGERDALLRSRNDEFRRTLLGGRVMMTAGVAELPDACRAKLIDAVRTFEDWSPDNDPHGEHDFGAIEIGGNRYFWKIDYFDPSLTRHSDDPTDPTITVRVLTVMQAEEY